MSNDYAIGFRYGSRVERLVVITAIDNLVKGAAGQAVEDIHAWAEIERRRGTVVP